MSFLKKGKKQSMRNKRTSPIHIGELISYLKKRSWVEEVNFELDDKFFTNHFNNGIRNFFGVTVSESGFPIFDEQQPYDTFHRDYMMDYYSKNIGR